MAAKRNKNRKAPARGGRRQGPSEKAVPPAEPKRRRRPTRLTVISVLLSAVSGVLWFLACADFDIWPLAWIAAVPSLWVIDRAPTPRRAAAYAWLTGIVANVGGFYWVSGMLTRFAHLPLALGIVGLVLLAAYQAVVFLLFGLAVRHIRDTSRRRLGAPLPMALLAPLAMVAFEILVPFIFPWYLAITQAWVVPVIQIAELTGPSGVTALLLAVAGAIFDLATERTARRRLVPAAGAAGILGSALVFGFVRIDQIRAVRADAPTIEVGVVQGNIAFDEKGVNNPQNSARQLRDLQRQSAELERRGAELILWSESAYPYRIPRSAERDFPKSRLARIRRGFTAPLVFGSITRDMTDLDAHPHNSALMLDRDGELAGRFDKIFLLVFGEYIPFYETFEWVRDLVPDAAGHFSRGDEIVTFPLEHRGERYRLGPMICYEDILPGFGRELGELHPHLLVNLTNDAWFGDTSEPWEHLALSVFRSVELRTDLVRAVNTGVSAFIDSTGRVHAETYAVDPKYDPRGVDGLIAEAALVEGGHTLYARFGDVFGYGCALVTGLLWLAWPRIRRRRGTG